MTANVTRQSSAGSFGASRKSGASVIYDEIVEYLARGISVQNIARMTGTSMQDVAKIKERVDVE